MSFRDCSVSERLIAMFIRRKKKNCRPRDAAKREIIHAVRAMSRTPADLTSVRGGCRMMYVGLKKRNLSQEVRIES